MNPTKRTFSLSLLALFAVSAFAGPFTPGNIVVSRVGDGSATLSSAAAAVFLDEYTPTGTLVQTVPLPTLADGGNRMLTNSGSATSEGMISRAEDKSGIVLVGYDAAVGTASVVSSTALTVNRIVGFVKADGTIDTTTNITDGYDANNIRSGTSADGTGFWTAGTGAGVTGGVRWIPYGPGQASTQISSTVTNTRVVRVFNGQLYVSTMSGAFRGVCTVGTGLPTTSGQTITLLNGFDPGTASAQSVYEFVFTDANTLYLADDRPAASGGGVQKWTFNGLVWTLQYTIASGSGTGGARGLVVAPDANGNVLYTTTIESSANNLMKAVDTGSGSAFSAIATAPPLTRFRGLSLSPETNSTTETLSPDSEAINLGNASGGDLTSWAADDANARHICKFIVPNLTSPFVRVTLNYTTTKPLPTAIDFIIKAKMTNAGVFKIRAFLQNKVSLVFDQVLADSAINLSFATYTGSATGTLANYVGSGGAMTGRLELQQAGISAVIFPCADFEFANMKVTG